MGDNPKYGLERQWVKQLMFAKTYGGNPGFTVKRKVHFLFWEQKLNDEYSRWMQRMANSYLKKNCKSANKETLAHGSE